jgi:DNA polymerase/3'-5' exonuclease PolX
MISLDKAKKVAIDVGNKLLPYCDRLNIAGSIRRGKQEVHDIEIVCQPKRVKIGNVDLFGEDTRQEVVSSEFVSEVKKLGKVIKGKPDGRMMQIELDNPFGATKIMLDLFIPQPYDYYRQFAIRTGSADYSAKVIATGWNKKGWVGTSDGLRLEIECVGYKNPADGKTKWTCTAKQPELPPAWQSEEEFFNWLGVQYIPPNLRFIST